MLKELWLGAVEGAPFAFEVNVIGAAARKSPVSFVVSGIGVDGATASERYRLRDRTHKAYLDLFAAVARRFGTRVPRNRQPAEMPTFRAPFLPLLTQNLSRRQLHGYGDPAVIRVGEWYYLVCTSNDAPDSFPVVRSRDLRTWEPRGFVFPRGQTPAWAATGEGVADYWAPEMHRVDGQYRVYFAAREAVGHGLCIGLATSNDPDGPWETGDAPVLRGGVIDPHVVVDDEGAAYLLWKDDANDVWPGLLHRLLYERADLIATLFADEAGRRTASFVATLWPWVRTLEPMERFFIQQAIVEAITDDFSAVRARLTALLQSEGEAEVRGAIRAVLDAMRTPVWAQRLSADGKSVVGERTLVLENDQEWEAHLIEGIWIHRHGGKSYLFYAGNDFSTIRYGIGVAVAEHPLGPYRKRPEPLLRSTPEWWGPGHPSVAKGPDGEPWLFLHAFFPGRMGYNEFRALLTVPLVLDGEQVSVRAADDEILGMTEMQTRGGVR